MTKTLSEKKHGTRARYIAGCDCKKCRMANSAYEYARRKVAGWDRPIGPLYASTESFAIDGGRLVVPVAALHEALINLSYDIKIETLSVLWHHKRKDGKK